MVRADRPGSALPKALGTSYKTRNTLWDSKKATQMQCNQGKLQN